MVPHPLRLFSDFFLAGPYFRENSAQLIILKETTMKYSVVVLALALLLSMPAFGSERDAIAISENIQLRHLPHGTILDPVFAAPESDEIVGYAHGGDSALWTGHYLAAESFRYRVTASPEALANVKTALAGIRSLVDVTRTNLLARCLIPVGSRYAQAILDEENRHGIYRSVLN